MSLNDKSAIDLNSTLQLAVSLCLNLAVCANKLQASEVALTCSSMVMQFFPRNAKTLFRKVVALKQLNRFSEACTTLEEASLIEPHNKDILLGLKEVKQSLAINKNGKRVVIDSLDANDARAEKVFVSSVQSQQVVSSPQHRDSPVCCNPCHFQIPLYVATLLACLLCLWIQIVAMRLLRPRINPKSVILPPLLTQHFLSSTLPIRSDLIKCFIIYLKLTSTHLGFYHPRSMSFMRVRPLISKTIQTGIPHDEIHGSAEIPTSSPILEENFLHSTNVDRTESVMLVKEEAEVQVDKKLRLNSDSPCPSKISSVQFEFAAVRDLSITKEGPIVDRYHTKGCKDRATATSVKRSMVECSFYRYTRNTVTVMRMKRKVVQCIEFDGHYHPPFKRSRLVSLFGTTCTWISRSFGAPNAPLFVP